MENINTIEQGREKEKYGVNVEVIIDLIRHGEKNGVDGDLTKCGQEEAEKYGEKLKEELPNYNGPKVYYSGINRTRKTGELINEKSKYKARERDTLNFSGQISDEFYDKLLKLVNEESGLEDKAIQAVLDTEDIRPDKETISSKEMSSRVAQSLFNLIKMSAKFKENSKVNAVFVSHSGMVENLIVDILKEERKGFIKKIGGPLNFLESARFIVKRKDKNNVKILFKFRNYEKEIAYEDLEKIVK